MSEMRVVLDALTAGSRSWDELQQLMGDTARDFADAPASVLAPTVRGAASTFLAAWARYARRSGQIATEFSGGLASSADGYRTSDDEVESRFTSLSAGLGDRR